MSDHRLRDFPPTQALAVFLAAARLGSLSRAAEEMNITHGAVSRRVEALEVWLGSSVFERHGRGVRLTPIGAKLAKRVERSMTAIDSVARDIRAAKRPDAVRISVLPSFARLWLVPNIMHLQGSPADLDVQITAEHRVASLEANEVDIAVRVGRGEWVGCRARRLLGERLYPVACPSIADAIGDDIGRLLSEPLLHDGNTDDWRRWFAAAGIAYRPIAGERRFDDYDLALSAAVAGAGIALARMPLATSVVEDRGLRRLPGPDHEIERGHWLVMRLSESRTPVLRLAERMLALGVENLLA